MTEHLPGTSRSPVVQFIVGVIAAGALMAAAFEAWYHFVLIPASIRGHRVVNAITALGNELCTMIEYLGSRQSEGIGPRERHGRH
jgi:hypothetical protein